MSNHYAIMLEIGEKREASVELVSSSLGSFQTTVYLDGAPCSPVQATMNAALFGTTRTSGTKNLFKLTGGHAGLVKVSFTGGSSFAILRQNASDSPGLRVPISPSATVLGTSFELPTGSIGAGTGLRLYVGNPNSSAITASFQCESAGRTQTVPAMGFVHFTVLKSSSRACIATTGDVFVQVLYVLGDNSFQSMLLPPN